MLGKKEGKRGRKERGEGKGKEGGRQRRKKREGGRRRKEELEFPEYINIKIIWGTYLHFSLAWKRRENIHEWSSLNLFSLLGLKHSLVKVLIVLSRSICRSPDSFLRNLKNGERTERKKEKSNGDLFSREKQSAWNRALKGIQCSPGEENRSGRGSIWGVAVKNAWPEWPLRVGLGAGSEVGERWWMSSEHVHSQVGCLGGNERGGGGGGGGQWDRGRVLENKRSGRC